MEDNLLFCVFYIHNLLFFGQVEGNLKSAHEVMKRIGLHAPQQWAKRLTQKNGLKE